MNGQWLYMDGARRAALLQSAGRHQHLQSGFPCDPAPGECEVCDVLWLIDQGEGEQLDNFFNLRDALEAAPCL